MYRDDRWEKGMYADDLVKFRCSSCGDEFIAGRTAVEKQILKVITYAVRIVAAGIRKSG